MPAASPTSSACVEPPTITSKPSWESGGVAEGLIIGGGPAGLSAAFELKRRGLSFLILEEGGTVGESWKRMPRHLKLVSPWKCNWLRGSPSNLFPRHYRISRDEFLRYLQDYSAQAGLRVQTDTRVMAVEKMVDGRFRVQTSRGDIFSRVVINATGYFSNPHVPVIPGASESRIPQLHAAEYRDPEKVGCIIEDTKRTDSPLTPALSPLRGEGEAKILIVGKRLSAGQIMVELAQAGFRVALSHRSPIQYGAEPLAWWFLFRVFPWFEWVKLKWKGNQAPSNDVRMAGGPARKLLESGKVITFPQIARFDTDEVLFENGQRLSPDLVLYATGFRPALQHLSGLNLSICAETGRPRLRDMESVSVPRLYFLGLDHGRNFQSRFLRGIRKDAAFLAEQLERARGETRVGNRGIAVQ